MVQYSFTSTETRRLVRTDSPGRPQRLSYSSWTMTFVVAVTVGLYKFYNRHTLYGQIRIDRDREIWRTELSPVIRLTNPTTQLQSSGAPGFSVGRSSNRAIPSCPFAERTACRWEHNQLQQKTELCGLTTFSLRLWHNIYPVPILCRRKQPAVTKQKHLWNDNGVWYARWHPVSILWRWTPNQS